MINKTLLLIIKIFIVGILSSAYAEEFNIKSEKINYSVTNRREGDPAKLYSSLSFAKKSLDWVAKNSDLENIIKTTWSIYKTRL